MVSFCNLFMERPS